ncbi:hypothetical protein B0H63DRAFT_424442 [Podospora didyma]|uniref:Vacuolar sorting protein Vps3844 C-terminal domain-containing protein n=1 Tax=Podospora didyma TaxID=330526 RepID=A0AAE0U6X5_9PEZI|nr:hypothetical protein B0H63DRAFT_424442 [Podospora didyma]
MRLLAGIAVAALSGLAVASQDTAEVLVLRAKEDSSTQYDHPRVSKEVARHVLLQRTSRYSYGTDLRDIPNTIDTDTAVDFIATYGKYTAPLFSQPETTDTAQLVIILEGTTAPQRDQLKEVLPKYPRFAINDPPSATANNRLMTLFGNLGIAPSSQCDLASAINPFDTSCWRGPSSAVKYDLHKSPDTLQTLLDNLDRLNKFVAAGDLEAMLVMMPESSRLSKLNNWSDLAAGAGASDLRRRNLETVIVDETITLPTEAAGDAAFGATSRQQEEESFALRPKGRIPHCFNSFNSCIAGTDNCSGHGKCFNKNTQNDTRACFSCLCERTVVNKTTTFWAGGACQKEDISVQFWLITGFTIAIIGAVTFSIGLLYSVGSETLPGVIGAGVSRTK